MSFFSRLYKSVCEVGKDIKARKLGEAKAYLKRDYEACIKYNIRAEYHKYLLEHCLPTINSLELIEAYIAISDFYFQRDTEKYRIFFKNLN